MESNSDEINLPKFDSNENSKLGVCLDLESLKLMSCFQWSGNHSENFDRILTVIESLKQCYDNGYRWKVIECENNKYKDDINIDRYVEQMKHKINIVENIDKILYRPYEICRTLLDKILSDEIKYGYAIIRPASPHSGTDKIGTFCGVNNVAELTLYCIKLGKRVGILDIDTHYSDGTIQFIGGLEGAIMVDLYSALFNRHQKNYDNIVKIITSNMTNQQYIDSIAENIKLFTNCDILLVSLGYDMMETENDGIELSSQSIHAVFDIIKQANIPTLFCLEGGYKSESLYNGTRELIYSLLAN